MKFKVSKKDLIIFIIFCIFLLYLSATAVANIKNVTAGLGFAGVSPMGGFAPNNIRLTFLIFFGALIAIFVSAGSYIFNREKGKGVGLSIGEKEEGGYSRWAKPQEIKKYDKVAKVLVTAKDADAAGIPLMNDGKVMYVDDGENHSLVIGQTASGKTTALVDPLVNSLAKKGESMIITDPKGEIYKNHCNYLKDRGYNVIVLNFRDPAMGSSWNPLTLPYLLYKSGNHDKSTELLDDVALNIFIDSNSKDPFWERSSADYFAGICLGLFEDAEESQININTVSYMSTVGEDRVGAGNASPTYIKQYFLQKGEDSTPYTFASNTINAPQDTKGSILSVYRQKIRIFAAKEDLSEMLSYTDFDLRNIGNEKTAIFMVIHDEKTTYHALATIFIKQCYETLVDYAYKQPNGKLPYRTNFILDEFANMPALKDVTSMVTAARSRSIRFTFIIQNFAQLVKVYGKDDAETIKSNCGNLIYILTTELAALEEISKLCGEVKAKGKDAEKTVSVPLVTVADLQKLKMNEVIIKKTRLNAFKTKLTPSFKIDWGHKFEKAEFYTREREPIQLFNLKEFVNQKTKETLLTGNPQEDRPKDPFSNPLLDMMNGPMPGMRDPFMDQNMGFGGGRSTQPKTIDDIIKELDNQIAELEKEEQKNDKPHIDNRDKYNKEPENVSKQDVDKPVVEPTVVEEKPVIEPTIIDSKPIVEPTIVEATPVVESTVVEEIKQVIEEPKINVPKSEESVIFTVQEPVIQETIIPTVEDIKQIKEEETKVVIETPTVEEIKQVVEEKIIIEPKVVIETPKVEEIKQVVEVKPIEEPKQDNDNLTVKDNYITDDQFFDDFFSDE